MFYSTLTTLLLAGLVASDCAADDCAATTTSALTPHPRAATDAACALVSSSSSAQIVASPSATPTVAAQLAHDCLNSVPLNKTLALELVDAMPPYLEWQSDLAWKKDPPADYFYPAHDILGYLASVRANLEADKYANEYEFQEDLYQVFARGHDGHYVFYPDALTAAFEWGRKRSLVSISEDGTSLPVIKLYEDVIANKTTAQIVSQINGEDAATYVANFVFTASFNQDADAAYNTMFFEKAFPAGGTGTGYFATGGRVRYIYPGPNTTFTLQDGSSFVLDNIAKVKGDFTGVTDGASFFEKFCTGDRVDATQSTSAPTSVQDVIAPGYPTPVVITNDTIVSGYYLDGEGYEDVAVLAVLAFENESPLEFQTVAQQFIADALRDGKTKMVIDVSANGGGYILQGYDLFRQFFPDIVQDGYTNWREADTLLTVAQIYSANSAGYDPSTATEEQIDQAEVFLNYRYDLNLTDQPFTSFDAKFAPATFKGDNFTQIMRWNLNDPLTTSNATWGLGTDITGYRSRANFTQPFKAENIILLEDGFCASTCTIFAEMMRIQGGVKNIAMGGRPKAGPIQGVGGIKGSQFANWEDVYAFAQDALLTANADQAAILNTLTSIPLNRSTSTGLNVRNQILRDNLDDGLPAQYVVEEADCRLYYTEPMITDVTELWKAAADAAFNGKACNNGALPKRDADVERRDSPAEARKRGDELHKLMMNEKRDVPDVSAASWYARHGMKAIP